MSDLHDTQRLFADALRQGEASAALRARLSGSAARNEAGLAIYRRNAQLNAHKALSLAYPVLGQVLGEEFLLALARDFLQAYPSRSGDLNEYGSQLADFLRPHPAARELPWLADLADLEWAVHEAGMAANQPAIAFESLRSWPAAGVARLRLGLQTALRLIDSEWPLASMWLQHQPDYGGELDLAGRGAETALILRSGWRVEVRALAPAEAAFWHAARAGLPLADLIAAALALDSLFDAAGCLQEAFAAGLIVTLESTGT